TSACAFVLLMAWRWMTWRVLDEDSFKRRVVVLGTGQRAAKIASRMRRRSDRRTFVLLGFIDLFPELTTNEVAPFGATIIRTNDPLPVFCQQNAIDEIVVAMDERRRNVAGGGMPLDELMECRLRGIEVC